MDTVLRVTGLGEFRHSRMSMVLLLPTVELTVVSDSCLQ